MGRVLRVFRAAVVAGLIATGVLLLFLPGNRGTEDGPADPIVDLRRPVLGLLRDVGLVPPPGLLGHDAWLPSGFSVKSWAGDEEPAEPQETVERHPVYRGLFWRIGMRVRCTVHGDDRYRRLRLVVLAADDRALSTEDGAEAGEGADLAVETFVPNDAWGWRLEGIDADGLAHGVRSEGRARD